MSFQLRSNGSGLEPSKSVKYFESKKIKVFIICNSMITYASKGQAISELIEWFRALSPMEGLLFIVTIIISILAAIFSHLLVRKYTEKETSNLFPTFEIIFSPISWFVIPTCVFLMAIGLLMVLFGLVEYFSPFVVSDCIIIILLLVISPFKKYSQCNIIKSDGIYYISKSWFGRNFERINNKTIRLDYSYYGFKVYNNKKLYGIISDPGNRPWLKSQKRKYDEFIEQFILS